MAEKVLDLANVALSVLDDHFTEAWRSWGSDHFRRKRRRLGQANYRLVRYADDFVVVVSGSKSHAEALRGEVAGVLAPMGLRLSEQKTRVVHIDEGFDFLGYRVKRSRKRGADRRYIYTYPSKAALAAVKAKVRALTRGATDQSLQTLLHRMNRVLRGWTNYFRYGVSSATFGYLGAFTWRRVVTWLRHKHLRASWKFLRRRYRTSGGPSDGGVHLFRPQSVSTIRYRFRGHRIPTPWSTVEPVAT